MRKRRLVAVAMVSLALAPGTFLRTELPQTATSELTITPLEDVPGAASSAGFTREGVWQFSSSRIDFGGYSAMLVLGDAVLRAFSDRGTMLTFATPGQMRSHEAHYALVWDRGDLSHTVPDIEAATRDPATGDYWLAFENSNSLIRFSAADEFAASRRPPAWQEWPENGGAEAFTRLPDGRFLVLPEGDSTGLLYPSDPTDEVEPLTFGFVIPDGHNPTDMAALPDGRVLVLLRRLDRAWPPFTSAIGIADPTTLDEGLTLDIDLLVQLDTILPRENYEALAVAGVEDDGTVGLWLMSDDNLASFQRTLLARLSWREAEDAMRESDGRARKSAREMNLTRSSNSVM